MSADLEDPKKEKPQPRALKKNAPAAGRRGRAQSAPKNNVVDFEQEEESCEKMNNNERNAAPKKISDAANKVKETLKTSARRLAAGKDRELGRLTAGAAAEGFGTAFRGVAEGTRALRRGVENKFPKSNKLFKAVGAAAGTAFAAAGKAARAAGKGLVSAGRGAGEKLKDLKESGALENAKNKLSQGTSAAVQELSQKSKAAGQRLGKAASGAAAGLKKAALNAGERLGELKEKADARREERRAARGADGVPGAEEKLKELSEKAASRFKNMRGEISEKTRKLAAGAKDRLRREPGEDAAGALKRLAGDLSAKTRDMVQKARAQASRLVSRADGESAPLGERLRGLKDKAALGARDLAEKAKSRLGALRAPEEETPGNPPAPEAPAVPPQPVSPADDEFNDYAAEEAVSPEMFRRKDGEK